jgi:rhomboid family protein
VVLLPIRDINPRARFPVATLTLILVNTGLYLLGLLLDPGLQPELVRRAGAIPLEIISLTDFPPTDLVPPPLTILSAMFLHSGFLHLVGNMWFLWIFGDNLEDRLGALRFVAFYLLTGVVGALAQCLLMPASTVPMLGASGAVAGVLGGYVMLFPRSRVWSWVVFGFVAIPAWIFLGLWFSAQLLFNASSGIAWMAHVGGFLAGLGSIRIFAAGRSPPVTVEYIPPPRSTPEA